MGRNKAILHLENIRKSFGGLLVLADIDLSVEQGQIVGLIGPNGAGKSTLFNIITTIYKPDAGDIFLNQQESLVTLPIKYVVLAYPEPFN